MNLRKIEKKMINIALENSSIFRKKYFDMFYRGKKTGRLYYEKNSDLQNILSRVNLLPFKRERFVHQIDENLIFFPGKTMVGNIPPDYSLVITHSFNDILEMNSGESEIAEQNRKTVCAVEEYTKRIIVQLEKQDETDPRIVYFKNMFERSANTLEDALQRILLWSSLFWQTGHKLVGLGRLDKLLAEIEDPRSDEEIVEVLYDFMLELHRYYEYKSATLLGDIGQIIILGGLDEDGTYFSNRYTHCILKAIDKAHITDPKVLLRVSRHMPKELLYDAVECLQGASGSPLFSNDDIVIPKLVEFGYDVSDAYNYVTSACWEPVSYGNSLEQNNLDDVKYADVFVDMMNDSKVRKCQSFEELVDLYCEHLGREIDRALMELSFYEWQRDPLYTLFTAGCLEKDLDISQGGAIYNDYGLLSIGMGNAINSLLNIKEDVFRNKKVTLQELQKTWTRGKNVDEVINCVKQKQKHYGHDEEEIIALTNQILAYTNEYISGYRNKFGGKVKVGLSSPNYISKSKKTGFTYDGRKTGDPVTVHISADDGVAYTELVSFASQLKYYPYGTNGNVIDFFVSPDFLNKNKKKFLDFIFLSIKQGFYQMQMNVMSSSELIAAKKNPEKYKGLIVRVWGFSAYFVDLPEEYQNLLIKRALRSEGKIA